MQVRFTLVHLPDTRHKLIGGGIFQDISQSRYRLIKALLDSSPESHLVCVGDDWQSIYRFAGSDFSIMTSFDKFFEYTEKMFLEENVILSLLHSLEVEALLSDNRE